MNWLSGSKQRQTGRFNWPIIASRTTMLLASLLLAGCGALGLAYSQLPTLSYWWLDDYFDFNSTQSAQVRNGLDAVAVWHKQTELEPYGVLLDQASALAASSFTPAQACRWVDSATQRADAFVAQAAPLAVPAMATLTPVQLEHYNAYIAERNAKWQDEQLTGAPQERLAFRLERSLKQLERFYGNLTTAQERLVEQRLSSSSYEASEAFDRRLANQAKLLDWLKRVRGAGPDSFDGYAQELRGVWRDSMQWPQAKRLQWCQQVVDFHTIMTPAQRQTASETLAAYARDFRALR